MARDDVGQVGKVLKSLPRVVTLEHWEPTVRFKHQTGSKQYIPDTKSQPLRVERHFFWRYVSAEEKAVHPFDERRIVQFFHSWRHGGSRFTCRLVRVY
jgi:hypothetical protein